MVAQLAAYVIESNRVLPVNKLACMYRQQRKDLGKPDTSKIHLKRFAEHLVTMAPEELMVEGEGPERGHRDMHTSELSAKL